MKRRDAIRLALGAAVGGTGGCGSERGDDSEGARGVEHAEGVSTTPEEVDVGARLWADGIVEVLRREEVDVVAYVSMETRRVFVDRDHRDRASWLLRAHISVSTWHWRIPLPGDDPGVPISPGDHAREFEELDISEWDPSTTPAFDDIRIVLGQRKVRRLPEGCVPIEEQPGGVLRLDDPVDVHAVRPGGVEAAREDFHVLGTGLVAGACGGPADVAQLVGWAQRNG